MDIWNSSKSGKVRIRLFTNTSGRFEVYALDGHELLPRTRSFDTVESARAYANSLWAAL
jgi:hypothetical protein